MLLKGSRVRCFAVAVLSAVCFPLAGFAARWAWGGDTPNPVDSVIQGQTGQVIVGDNTSSGGTGTNQVWYWTAASGISFYPSSAMSESESSDELRAGKSAGGTCSWEMKFHFSRPVSRFRFETPYSTGIALESGDFYIEYALNDEATLHELWRYGAASSGYESNTPIDPQWTDWVELETNEVVEDITLRFVLEGYVGKMYFRSDTDDGGVLEYTTLEDVVFVPSMEETANTYYVDDPPSVLLPLGLLASSNQVPDVDVYDLGRDRIAGSCVLVLSNDAYHVELPVLQAGSYELRLTPAESEESIQTHRFTLVHPARDLTSEQMRQSPFGIKMIERTTPYQQSCTYNGPLLGKMIGTHQIRGGLGSWVLVNTSEGVYDWDESLFETATNNAEQYGLVYRGYLNWTPRWAVDADRIAEGDWFGHYPPQSQYLEDYAEFCRQAAERVQGPFAPEFEVWNEPNNEPYGFWKGTFNEFSELNHTAADAVHSVNPDARMILGSTGNADADYIADLLQSGLSNKFQIVDVHPYRYSNRGPEDGVLVDIRRIQRVIDLYGSNQSIIFSEIGWPTYTEGEHSLYAKVTRFQQACYFSRTLLIGLAAGVERIHFHMLPDWGTDPANPEHHFGIIDIYGEPKPALSALSTTQRHLEHAEFKGVATGTPDDHHVWAWDTPWETNAVLLTIWCDTHNEQYAPEWIDLPGTPLDAEDLWGGEPDSSRLRNTNSVWQVLPDEDPLFVYVDDATALDLTVLPTAMRSWHVSRLTQNDTAFWLCDRLDGGTMALDELGSNELSLSTNVPTLVSDVPFEYTKNRALQFDGTQYLEGGTLAGSGLDLRSVLTIEAWVKCEPNLYDGDPLVRIIAGNENAYGLICEEVSGGESLLGFVYQRGGQHVEYFSQTASDLSGEWHHLAATFNAYNNEIVLYIDGVADGNVRTADGSGELDYENVPFFIGGDGAGGNFVGTIDEVRVCKAALTDAEFGSADTFRGESSGLGAISIYRSTPAGVVGLSWDSDSWGFYDIQSKQSLTNAAWSDYITNVTGKGGPMNVRFYGTQPQAFYRVIRKD